MEIKTKFNLKQVVYPIVLGKETYKEKCPFCEGKGYIIYKGKRVLCNEEGCWGEGYITKQRDKQWYMPKNPIIGYVNFTIGKIGVDIYDEEIVGHEHKDRITYMQYTSGTVYYEKDLFTSEKEAQEECDRRNKEITE